MRQVISFKETYLLNTVGISDPYWRMIELRRAFEAKRIVERQRGRVRLPLALYLSMDTQKILSKNPERFPL